MRSVEGVLISGSGVVGLITALSLARKGIPVTVLEAEPELMKEYRASTFHPPTLEMLDELGVAESLIAQGLIADRFQYRDRNEGLIAEFDLSVLKDDTRYPFRLQVHQYALAVLLYEQLVKLPNAEVHFRHRVAGVTLADDHVSVDVETSEGRKQFRGAYLVGADGATSAVRHALGIGFEGMTYPIRYLVLFTTAEFADYLPGICDINYVSDPTDWFMLLRTPDVWRILFPTRPNETDEEAVLDDVIEARLQGIVQMERPYPVTSRNLYSVHQRVATTYRKGRALLAGDAAHVNSPIGGMGLNGGIHDAVNLSGKLARVWHGEVGDELLDAYSNQRRQTAVEYVQVQTKRNVAEITEADPEVRKQRHEEMRRIAADRELLHQYLLRTSMIESLRSEARAS